IYDRFADDARYSIHIANPVTGETTIRYDFRFSDVNPLVTPGLKNPNTILSYGLGTELGPIITPGDARQNYTQTYTVTRLQGGSSAVIGSGLVTPPPNVGLRTTPDYNDPTTGAAVSGATVFAELDSYTQATIHDLSGGEAAFAGPREDGFFADIPGIFDRLDPRILATGGNGVDGFKGFNVLSFALQIPLSSLTPVQYPAAFADLGNPNNPLPSVAMAEGVGVYASVSRPRLTLRRTNGEPLQAGPMVQVNRMGNPVFNEALVALQDKDNYNRASPPADAASFAAYALNPELALLLNTVFGTSFVATGRSDLALVYIPDVLRVDTTTGPVRLAGQPGFSRLGFIGGDTATNAAGRTLSSGWPNGRRLGDDVIDIALTAIASGPSYAAVTVVGDNVAANDQVYHQVFPYSATPNAGTNNRKDP
nr:DUF4331 domain-containing protein [Pseudomonadota bacterium]